MRTSRGSGGWQDGRNGQGSRSLVTFWKRTAGGLIDVKSVHCRRESDGTMPPLQRLLKSVATERVCGGGGLPGWC